MTNIPVKDLQNYINENKKLCYIDVRTPAEFESEHIEKFRNIPLDQLGVFEKELSEHHTIVFSCRSGNRSAIAAKQMAGKTKTVLNVEGGLTAWRNAGFPTIKGSNSVLSVIKQVVYEISYLSSLD
ncbi:hypothetical protein DID78_06670 [Candidatus Marinamargulisbacteria bacterium SCGC AG-343-D04]|nr:hypothetical protein DID78_06670 [Candidatus Marinamargulisbacteria bacterium SCGC AG-343-D04]